MANGSDAVMGEMLLDGREQRLERRIRQFGATHGHQQVGQCLHRRSAPVLAVQCLFKLGETLVRHAIIGETGIQRVGRADVVTGQAHVEAEVVRQARQEIATAHIREVTDADLRHAHSRALGNHSQRGSLNQAHAAAEHEAVHQRQQGFAVGMDVLVQRIFFLEERPMQAVAALVTVVQRADIAAGAEGFLASAAQHHGDHIGVVRPGLQLLVEHPHHGQRNGVQPGGAIECEIADAVAYLDQYRRFCLGHVSSSWR